MNLLIDTHAFLWYINGDKQLPSSIIDTITDVENQCYVSIASLWEIVIKLSLHKLEIKGGFATIEQFLNDNDFEILPIDFNDTKTLLELEFHHRDPFDRMIIAQAKSSDLTIVSKDQYFKQYDVVFLW